VQLQGAVTRERLHCLMAPQGRAAQDPHHWVILQADHEPLGFAASGMFVSVNTVKTHVRSILRKPSAERRKEAVRRARELDLI